MSTSIHANAGGEGPAVIPTQHPSAGAGMETKGVFAGFDRPRASFYRLPLEWFDLWRFLRGSEGKRSAVGPLKVVEYVLKHTWGEQNFTDSVGLSLSNFQHGRAFKSYTDRGTGLTRASVSQAIRFAVSKNLLTEIVDRSDAARIAKRYQPRLRPGISLNSDGGTIADMDAADTVRIKAEDIPGRGFDSPQANYFSNRKIPPTRQFLRKLVNSVVPLLF